MDKIDDRLERYFAELEETDPKDQFEALERIQALIYHLLKNTSKTFARIAEEARTEAQKEAVATMRSNVVLVLGLTSAAFSGLAATSSFAPHRIHGLGAAGFDWAHYDMSSAQGVQSFSKMVSKMLSGYSSVASTGSDLVGKRNEAHRIEHQSDADRSKTIQDEMTGASRDEGQREDASKDRMRQREGERHRLAAELMGR